MNETGREQDIQYMEQLEQVTAERDRLREALEIASLHLGKIADLTDARTHNFALSCKKDVDAALQEGEDG